MRRRDWRQRFEEVIRDPQWTTFRYGVADCVLFAATCVDAISEVSHWVDEMRSLYSSRASAIRRLAAEGGLEEAVTKRLGEPVALQLRPGKPYAGAVPGDVCSIETPQGLALGICYQFSVIALGKNGLLRFPLNRAVHRWPIL